MELVLAESNKFGHLSNDEVEGDRDTCLLSESKELGFEFLLKNEF